jgi:uncharacterized protein YecT (DUF1311 family)
MTNTQIILSWLRFQRDIEIGEQRAWLNKRIREIENMNEQSVVNLSLAMDQATRRHHHHHVTKG